MHYDGERGKTFIIGTPLNYHCSLYLIFALKKVQLQSRKTFNLNIYLGKYIQIELQVISHHINIYKSMLPHKNNSLPLLFFFLKNNSLSLLVIDLQR